jgi:hypothetical protein
MVEASIMEVEAKAKAASGRSLPEEVAAEAEELEVKLYD